MRGVSVEMKIMEAIKIINEKKKRKKKKKAGQVKIKKYSIWRYDKHDNIKRSGQ